MTSAAPTSDGNGGQDAGIGMSTRPADVDEIRRTIGTVTPVQSDRERNLADVRHRLDITDNGGDDATTTRVIAATDVAAADELDEPLRTPRNNETASSPGGAPEATENARTKAERWADAGYTSASAVADWTSIGIDTPEIARQWSEAGFTAESAARWVDVPDMTPAEAATCAHGGMTPTDVQRIRRADPGWARPEPEPPAPQPGYGIEL